MYSSGFDKWLIKHLSNFTNYTFNYYYYYYSAFLREKLLTLIA